MSQLTPYCPNSPPTVPTHPAQFPLAQSGGELGHFTYFIKKRIGTNKEESLPEAALITS